ncbi:MAG: PrgI family protein [Oscillospiraceae bacterium]
MATCRVPADTRDKEKLFGGKFTLSQFIFIIMGIVFGGALGLLFNLIIPHIISIIVGILIGVICFFPFGFYKVRKMGDIELAKYLYLKYLFNKKTKNIVHINENYLKFKGGR